MIKVLNIISDTNVGGAGRVILNYLRYADRTRFRILVALPRGSLLIPELEKLDAELLPVDGLDDRSYHRDDVRALCALIREVKPDIVHTHGALSGRVAGRRCGVKVIYTRHSAFPVPAKLRYPPGRWVNKLVNEHYADHIIAVSPAAAENLTDAGISPKKITVVMNGVSPVERRSAGEREALRRQWGIAPGEFVLGILARIEDYKGHLDILEAARILEDQGRSFRILIAGTGAFEEEVRRRAEALGLRRVVLMGFQRDVPGVLSMLDAQLNASYGTEATSMALLEGMSLGLPTVASDYGGNPYVVADGETGLVFPTRDTDALAESMARLMDDPALCARLGSRAREVFLERFTGEAFARNVEAVYMDVMKGDK